MRFNIHLIHSTIITALLMDTVTSIIKAESISTSINLQKRKATGDFNELYSASNHESGSISPGTINEDDPGQNVVIGGTGAHDESQRPGCSTIFISSAQVRGSEHSGWQEIPDVVGFDVDRNLTYDQITKMPIYIESNKDFHKIKRVLITQPGKPRDSWKYANLFRNSLNCAIANKSMNVHFEDVLIVSPIWITVEDRQAGAGNENDIYFSFSGWDKGFQSQGPNDSNISSFQIIDDLIKRFSDQSKFPSLTSIIIAGHSLGGFITQRYAMIRNSDPQTDPLLSYWVGNPGAYVWPSFQRPVQPWDTSCDSTVNDWAYGVGGNLPDYVKGNLNADFIYSRYRSKTIQYALGLRDFGKGDTHCEAQYQGSSHLERGENMRKALEQMRGGMPLTQTFNYVPNTKHQDYLMMADSNSQEYLFVKNLNKKRPKGTKSFIRGDVTIKGSLIKPQYNSSNKINSKFLIWQIALVNFISLTILMIWI